jgi:hypothetical protein
MRRLLLGVLLVPLFVRPAVDPYRAPPEFVPPAGFPLDGYTLTIPTHAANALLVPLDPGSEAFHLSDAQHGVRSDVDGDGVPEMSRGREANANVAFLTRDTNGDGRITSGKELLGSATYADVYNGCNALLTMFKRSGAELSGSDAVVRCTAAPNRHRRRGPPISIEVRHQSLARTTSAGSMRATRRAGTQLATRAVTLFFQYDCTEIDRARATEGVELAAVLTRVIRARDLDIVLVFARRNRQRSFKF